MSRGANAWETDWKTWEQNLSMHEAQSGEAFAASTKIAILTLWAPSDVKTVICQSLGSIGSDYGRLSQVVRDFVASGEIYESSGV